MSTDNQLLALLKNDKFKFNKGLGQNFIFDKNLLKAIVHDASITSDDTVVEIGTGAGTLTLELAAVAKKVYTFEVDKNLSSILEKVFKPYDNIDLHFKDILRMKQQDFKGIVNVPFKVVANLPYYITTPLIMYFIESDLPVESLTVMMQKEVADRLVAESGTADYSAITLAIQIEGSAKIVRKIHKEMFIPIPQVDSALVKIDIDRNKIDKDIKSDLKKLVRSSFMMRRKTILNNLAGVYKINKEELSRIFKESGIRPNQRGEELTLDQYKEILKNLNKGE